MLERHLGLLRWAPDPSAQQMLDAPLQHCVGLDPNGIEDMVVLQVLVDRRHRERGIGSEVHRDILAAVQRYPGFYAIRRQIVNSNCDKKSLV